MPAFSPPHLADDSRPVVAILLGADAFWRVETLEEALGEIEARHPGLPLIVVTRPSLTEEGVKSRTVWTDGAGRGFSGFLALARRLAWSSPATVYDLSPCAASRLLRILVWPRPKWRIWTGSRQK